MVMAALTSSLSLNAHFLTTTTTTTSSSSSTSSVLKPISLSLYKKQHNIKAAISLSSSSSFTGLFGAKSKGGGGGGASVLERPPPIFYPQFDPATQVEQGGDIGRVKDRRGPGSADGYRVLLLDDIRHTEDLVVKVLPQAVPVVTPDGARELFHVSRENGLAVVIVTVKEHAEFYAQMMVRGGLRSTIEPDSSVL